MTTELVPKVITPSEVFIPNGLDNIIAGVEKIIAEETAKPFDIDNEKDREQRKSFSYQISRSKTFVDDKGKNYVAELKKKTKEIDAERKRFRDLMDKYRDDTRAPVTEWENAEKIRAEKEREFEIYLMDWDEAIAEDSIFTREREIAKKEAKFARIEAERKAKEESDRLEKERIENEARIKREAEEKASIAAEEKIQAAKEAKEKAERDAEEAKIRAEWEAKEALVREENARLKAEEDRIAAEAKAKADQEAAVKKAHEDAAEKSRLEKEEADRIAAAEKAEADKRAANKRHQASINNKILEALTTVGIDPETGKKLIIEIAHGNIPFLQINY